jgi:hypothetical protein
MATLHISTDVLSGVLFGAVSTISYLVLRKRSLIEGIPADKSAYEAKVAGIQAGGTSKLQIIMDFDRTITCYGGPRGGRGHTCHGEKRGTSYLTTSCYAPLFRCIILHRLYAPD